MRGGAGGTGSIGARLATSALLATAAAVGCSHAPASGNIELVVDLPEPVTIPTVDYTVTHGTAEVLSGSMAIPAGSSSSSRFLSHVPVGDGYTVQASARSTDGHITCEAEGTAEVKSDATTLVHLDLPCRDDRDGQILVTVTVQCPSFEITSYSVSPLVASLGGTIDVSATTSATDGGAATFLWAAPTGAFTDPAAGSTTYTCKTAGTVELEVTAMQGSCSDERQFPVTCGMAVDAGTQ